ncbi:MipA/OmpV family protein [Neisseriaceae bacterium TC5R-5]|nr:MipA/OmpV family protein [Neisseriaceae bacterium TC5R-5]
MNKLFIPAILALLGCQNALANTQSLPSSVLNDTAMYDSGWAIGIGAAIQSPPYKDYDNQTRALPIISYKGEHFYIEGLSAGVYLYKDKQQSIYADISYQGLNFDPGDTDNAQLRLLDKRKSTVMAGLGYNYKDSWGSLGIHAAGDTLGRSDGLLVDLKYSYPFLIDKLQLAPSVGVEWANSKHNDYYYGIDNNEASRSGLPAYSVGSTASPYLGLFAGYQINRNFSVFMNGRVMFLHSDIKDSPMVDANQSSAVVLGVQYRF